MSNNPLLVGITGGIGAGKSVVCGVFKSLKVPVYDADDRAKWLMTHDAALIKDIKLHFGSAAYLENGQVNRAFLASEVFHDKNKLDHLNGLVHPKVGEDFMNWVEENHRSPYLIKEAALLFESGSYHQLDKIINVDAPVEIRKKRVSLRDKHRTDSDIQAIIDQQWSDQQRNGLADYIITNDDHSLVIPQVLALHQQLKVKRVD